MLETFKMAIPSKAILAPTIPYIGASVRWKWSSEEEAGVGGGGGAGGGGGV